MLCERFSSARKELFFFLVIFFHSLRCRERRRDQMEDHLEGGVVFPTTAGSPTRNTPLHILVP